MYKNDYVWLQLEISKRKDVLEEDIVKAASKETEHTTQIKDLEKECKLLQVGVLFHSCFLWLL